MTRSWGTRAGWDTKEQSGVGGRVVGFSLETGIFHGWLQSIHRSNLFLIEKVM